MLEVNILIHLMQIQEKYVGAMKRTECIQLLRKRR